MAGNGMKSLAKDTAIYGLSSILGRLINWCLVPLHIIIFTDTIEYGNISQMYGLTAIFLVLLTFGLETGFFRFMNKKEEDSNKVYSTSLIFIGGTSLLFVLFCISFIHPISDLLRYSHREHIMIMAIVVALDAFMSVPFAYLRYKQRPIRFATLKLASIFIYVFLNIFFLIICPWISEKFPGFVLNKFFHQDIGVGYVFLANLISSLVVLILLIPSTMKGINIQFDRNLLNRLLKYSFPLLILGLAGVINQTVAPLVYPYIFGDDVDEARRQLGIYSASLKFTVIITMFIQAFRYAYEPFIFSQNKEGDNRKPYADAMKYFIIFTLFIFLGIMFYVDIIQLFMEKIGKNYAVGLTILPIAMLGEIFFGIYYNLSVWYKLTDKTKYGAYFSIFGCVIQVSINVIFVPIYGYIASAWATLICNTIIMSISYFMGQKHYMIRYDLKKIFLYFLTAAIFYALAMYPQIENDVLRLLYRTVFLILFTVFIVKRDLPIKEIPVISKLARKFEKKDEK